VKKLVRRPAILAVLLVAAFTAAGVAYGTIPDGNHVYQACMLKSVGTVRLIDPSLPATNILSHCTSLEQAISWNQVGQQGPQGAQGPQGPQGPKGDPGVGANLTSPNGLFKVDITNHGVYLRGPSGTVYVDRFHTGTSSNPNFGK
jgi:hypothetical protein